VNCIVLYIVKIHKYLIIKKRKKKYRYTYVKDILIINLEYIQQS